MPYPWTPDSPDAPRTRSGRPMSAADIAATVAEWNANYEAAEAARANPAPSLDDKIEALIEASPDPAAVRAAAAARAAARSQEGP